jgi:hypothetical protein
MRKGLRVSIIGPLLMISSGAFARDQPQLKTIPDSVK